WAEFDARPDARKLADGFHSSVPGFDLPGTAEIDAAENAANFFRSSTRAAGGQSRAAKRPSLHRLNRATCEIDASCSGGTQTEGTEAARRPRAGIHVTL